MAPYFLDEHMGIVQSPQFFAPDKYHHNWLEYAAGATQELFYRWVQPARDSVNAAICVGTNAIYRRRALDAAGGFAQIGHSEDVHTGVNLAKQGFYTRYVPVNLAKGVCPDDFDGFVNQQYRWCTGSMSLLADRNFHRAPLTFWQKACFWTGFLYYISTAVAVFAVQIPSLVMVWVFPEHIKPGNYLPVLGTVLVWAVVMPALTSGRWKPVVVRAQTLIGFCHALALVDAVRGRTAAWVPTGAAKKTPTARRVLRIIRAWVVTTQAAFWVGVGLGVDRFGIHDWWASILFALPSFYFLLPLTLGSRSLRRPKGEPPHYVQAQQQAAETMAAPTSLVRVVRDEDLDAFPTGFEDAYRAQTAATAPYTTDWRLRRRRRIQLDPRSPAARPRLLRRRRPVRP